MKGDKFTFTPKEISDTGISPRVIRLTDEKYTCNHLYFHNRSFTPDDNKVVFESTKDGGNNLFVIDLKTNEVTQLTENKNLDYFGYISRDGKKVFFGDGSYIKAVYFDTLKEEVVVDANVLTDCKVTKCSGAFPSWDGKKLVCFYEAVPEYGLIVKDLETGEQKVIERSGEHVRHCQFCPKDSNLIMYAHEGDWATIQARMWLINADGSNNRRVRDHDDGEFEQAGHEFWANTERKLYFTVRREGKVFFSNFDVDTNTETTMFDLENEHGTITMDDKYIITDSKHSNGEMHIVNIATGEVHPLCHHNMSWKKDMSRFHPHPTVSYKTNKAIYTSDYYGNPGVFIADIPEF